MFGLLCLYENDNVSLTVIPDPDRENFLLLTISAFGLTLPAMAIPVDDLLTVIKEATNGKQEAK